MVDAVTDLLIKKPEDHTESEVKNRVRASVALSDKTFLQEVLEGLNRPQKSLPCKYFYDETGSQLFEKICTTPEYYVTRAETSIYAQYAHEMAAHIGGNALLIEPGAGSVKKVSYLLEAMEQPAGFIPTDISESMLQESCNLLRRRFPHIPIEARVLDFSDETSVTSLFDDLPADSLVNSLPVKKRVIFFPGSTIGNFSPKEAEEFLRSLASSSKQGDGLLIGVDKFKDKAIIEPAYNDQQGVTAAFNLNLLSRINQELGANFDLQNFSHQAFLNEEESRIEMHLLSNKQQRAIIANQQISFSKGETIHTENSYKYRMADFIALAERSGCSIKAAWEDDDRLFSVYYFDL